MDQWSLFNSYNMLANQLVAVATKEQLAECARILAMHVAHYKERHGEIPSDELEELLHSNDISEERAALLATGMEGLVGVLGGLMLEGDPAEKPN